MLKSLTLRVRLRSVLLSEIQLFTVLSKGQVKDNAST